MPSCLGIYIDGNMLKDDDLQNILIPHDPNPAGANYSHLIDDLIPGRAYNISVVGVWGTGVNEREGNPATRIITTIAVQGIVFRYSFRAVNAVCGVSDSDVIIFIDICIL